MDAVFPFETVYEPNHDAFSRNEAGQNFLEYFESWEVPTDTNGDLVYPTIFKLKVRENPGDDLEYIADIVLTSDIFRSKYGDETLWFKHEIFSTDLSMIIEQEADGINSDKYILWEASALDKVTRGVWGTMDVNDLPEDDDDAQAVIEHGIRTIGCPFAWLLDDTVVETALAQQ